ncbi:MAG: hypothetical protein LCH67_04595 [Bacteroidetes bacterium]|nr:hypothetical protein [Bacteroidota bacterium]
MRIPLEFRLLLLAALGLRLLASAKKRKKSEEKESVYFNELPDFEPIKGETFAFDNLKNNHKNIYRSIIRGHETDNKLFFLIFLIQKLEKSLSKGGIYRFFWFEPHLVAAFYESLVYLGMTGCSEKFGEILSQISNENFLKLKNHNYPLLSAQSFQVDGDCPTGVFEKFGSSFLLENYIEAVEKKFFLNQ